MAETGAELFAVLGAELHAGIPGVRRGPTEPVWRGGKIPNVWEFDVQQGRPASGGPGGGQGRIPGAARCGQHEHQEAGAGH